MSLLKNNFDVEIPDLKIKVSRQVHVPNLLLTPALQVSRSHMILSFSKMARLLQTGQKKIELIEAIPIINPVIVTSSC